MADLETPDVTSCEKSGTCDVKWARKTGPGCEKSTGYEWNRCSNHEKQALDLAAKDRKEHKRIFPFEFSASSRGYQVGSSFGGGIFAVLAFSIQPLAFSLWVQSTWRPVRNQLSHPPLWL